MATGKTKLTELGTAVGLVYEPSAGWPDGLEQLVIPGIADEVWKPVIVPATSAAGANRELLLRALANGRTFRQAVLKGRLPETVEWSGGTRAVWVSDVPRDLTVDGVWFVQAKYDSTCVLNTAPGILFDDLLVDDEAGNRASWFEEVALRELQAYYEVVRRRSDGYGGTTTRSPGTLDESVDPGGSAVDDQPPTLGEIHRLPDDVRDLEADDRRALKALMRARPAPPDEVAAYAELCRSVSVETVRRWRLRLRASTAPQRTQMLFRMLRIAGGPYWLLGTKGQRPVQLRVTDTRTWRDRYHLKGFTVVDAHAGQPQVNWRAEVVDRSSGERRHIEGYCEIRWSHGKLQGNPECKVQVTTPLTDLPGYEPMA
jgi:hypothetical protein